LPVEIRKTLGINIADKLELALFVSEGKIIFTKRCEEDGI